MLMFHQDSKGESGLALPPFRRVKDPAAKPASSRVTHCGAIGLRNPLAARDGQLGIVRVGLGETVQSGRSSTCSIIVSSPFLVFGVALSIMRRQNIRRSRFEGYRRLITAAGSTPPFRFKQRRCRRVGRSLERMRASLKAAMIRLNRE